MDFIVDLLPVFVDESKVEGHYVVFLRSRIEVKICWEKE